MSKRKVFISLVVLFVVTGIALHMMPGSSGPKANMIYLILSQLYGRPYEDVTKMMGEPDEKVSDGNFKWNLTNKSARNRIFKSEDFLEGSSISCTFQDDLSTRVAYTEISDARGDADRRYKTLRRTLSKKLGTPEFTNDILLFTIWTAPGGKRDITLSCFSSHGKKLPKGLARYKEPVLLSIAVNDSETLKQEDKINASKPLTGAGLQEKESKISYPIRTDISFEWLVEPIYNEAWPFQEGLAWVEEKENSLYTLLDKEGNIVKKDIEAYSVTPFSEGRACIRYAEPSEEKAGIRTFYSAYLNTSGDVVSSGHGFGGEFSSGLAAIAKRVKEKDSINYIWGFIDRDGKMKIPFQYEWVRSFSGNMAAAGKNGKHGFINREGKVVLDFRFDIPKWSEFPFRYPHKCQVVRFGGKEGLLNDKGGWVIKPEYDRIYCGGDPLFGLQKDGKVGFMNLSGDIVIDFQFPGVPIENNSYYPAHYRYRFFEGRAVVRLPTSQNSSFGVIDTTGKLLFEINGVNCGNYSEGFLTIQKKDKNSDIYTSGLLDRDGNWIPLPEKHFFRAENARAWDIASEVRGGIVNVTVSETKNGKASYKAGYLKLVKKGR